MINAELGYIIMILDAKVDEMGKMIAGDGGTFHKVQFEALTFYPKLQEIVQGEIVDITDFGAFVRIGPTDALLHLSQVMDDYLKSDVKMGLILANQSGRTLKVGSTLRARITAVSLGKAAAMGKKAAVNILKEKYESMINAELGYIIMILDAKVDEMGKMIAGDGGTFHKVKFEALTFYPKLQEIVQGEIVDITDFGAFVRIGPTDALLHLSQVMDDYLKSDVKSGLILANQSGRTLKVGSTLRARITAVSLGKAAAMGKIGITCRQPFLGADEWIKEEIKKADNPDKPAKEAKVEAS
jgi:DNA-directed RNA polymerase subunit E'